MTPEEKNEETNPLLQALFDAFSSIDVKTILGGKKYPTDAEVQAFLDEPDDPGLLAKLYGIPFFEVESLPVTHRSQRRGLATEYPELRDEFESNLAETPLARWAEEVA